MKTKKIKQEKSILTELRSNNQTFYTNFNKF